MIPALAAVGDNVIRIVIWCLVLIVAIVVLFVGVWYYRRRWFRMMDGSGTTAWTFDDLHRLREQGQISEEEYRALRASLVAAFKGEKSPTSGSTGTSARGEVRESGDDFELRNPPSA